MLNQLSLNEDPLLADDIGGRITPGPLFRAEEFTDDRELFGLKNRLRAWERVRLSPGVQSPLPGGIRNFCIGGLTGSGKTVAAFVIARRLLAGNPQPTLVHNGPYLCGIEAHAHNVLSPVSLDRLPGGAVIVIDDALVAYTARPTEWAMGATLEALQRHHLVAVVPDGARISAPAGRFFRQRDSMAVSVERLDLATETLHWDMPGGAVSGAEVLEAALMVCTWSVVHSRS